MTADKSLLEPLQGTDSHQTLTVAGGDEVIVDNYKLVYFAMLMLGIGVLFPYNACMAASDYYDKTWPGKDLTFYAPLAISVGSPLVQFVMVHLAKYFSYSKRVVPAFVAYSFLVVFIPLSVLAFSNQSSFFVVLVLFLALGFVNAVVQATIFSFSAMFPPAYTQAIMAGNGWSGIIVSISRCITKAALPETDSGYRDGAFIFFGISAFITTLCVFTFYYVIKNPFTKQFVNETPVEKEELLNNTLPALDSSVYTDNVNSINDNQSIESPKVEEEEVVVDKKAVFMKIWPSALAVFAIFTMTFLVFPGRIASVKPTFDMSKGWFTTLLILEFNVFDLIGRTLATNKISLKVAQFVVYARFLLYPLMFMCGHQLKSSWYIVVLNAIMATTNGFISSSIMMITPGLVEPHERPTSGGFMSMFLVAGILVGSSIALIVEKST